MAWRGMAWGGNGVGVVGGGSVPPRTETWAWGLRNSLAQMLAAALDQRASGTRRSAASPPSMVRVVCAGHTSTRRGSDGVRVVCERDGVW